ncbi:MAG: XdhC family protein [Acidobacteriota bacterium]|nr:MAG: XdhC family protein [Acidobacteriota bacterium]
MRELRDILRAIEAAGAGERPLVLATLVRREGSSYRRPGARWLWSRGAPPVGILGGGCFEDDVAEHAAEVCREGQPRLVRYDLSADEESLVWGLGVGCPGIVEVLIEGVPERDGSGYLETLRDWMVHRRRGVVVTVGRPVEAAPVRLGQRVLVDESGVRYCDLPRGPASETVIELARALVAGSEGDLAEAQQRAGAELFVERFARSVALWIFGAGADVPPLVEAASALGWSVSVIDDRPLRLDPARFGRDVRLIHASRGSLEELPGVDDATAALVSTHSFARDAAWLAALLGIELPYLGLVSSRKRRESLLGALPAAARQRLHAPAGLDIGSETPQEIALAIVAEIRAVLAGRAGGLLRDSAPRRARDPATP